MPDTSPRRYEMVAAPAPHAGLGNSLRTAFAGEGETRPPGPFEDLLALLA